MAFLLLYVTHSSESEAQNMANSLLGRRLVACANIFPVSSGYWWQNALQQDREWVCLLKTRLELETELERIILAEHPYETPCILRFEVRANRAYEDWIAASTDGAVVT